MQVICQINNKNVLLSRMTVTGSKMVVQTSGRARWTRRETAQLLVLSKIRENEFLSKLQRFKVDLYFLKLL